MNSATSKPSRAVALILAIGVGVLAWLTLEYHDANAESDARGFIDRVRPALMADYGTPARAKAAGFSQMTPLGWDGTAIYFTRTFDRVDPLHPNFLWYDRHGHLVGVDYELPIEQYPMNPPRHDLFPVRRMRWTIVEAHAHFAYALYSQPVFVETAAQPNFALGPVTRETLRDAGLLPANAELLWFSFHPRCWDLSLWLAPNPFGASAAFNPFVYW